MIAPTGVDNRRRRLLLAGCWLSLCLATVTRLHAAPPESETAKSDPVAAPVDGEKRAPVDPELKKWVWQAVVMLGGIIVVGTFLLLVVVLWGNRTRRLARKPLPAVARRDELWFLKPKPPVDPPPGRLEPHDTDG